MSVRVKRSTTDQGGFGFKLQVKHIENFDCFGHDFGANAVAWQNCDFHASTFWCLNRVG
jgi:hypothetical protein